MVEVDGMPLAAEHDETHAAVPQNSTAWEQVLREMPGLVGPEQVEAQHAHHHQQNWARGGVGAHWFVE